MGLTGPSYTCAIGDDGTSGRPQWLFLSVRPSAIVDDGMQKSYHHVASRWYGDMVGSAIGADGTSVGRTGKSHKGKSRD